MLWDKPKRRKDMGLGKTCSKVGNIVLFVDDEEYLLHAIRRELQGVVFETMFANSGEEALEILQSNDVSVIVSDLNMPGLNGMELLRAVKVRMPDVIRVIVTGSADFSTILSAIHAGETHRYIKKPINFQEDLIPTIQQSIELYNLRMEKKVMVKKIIEYNEELEEKNKTLLAQQKQLLIKEKLEGVLEMAVTISHEFSQPLSVILGYADMMLEDIDKKNPHHKMVSKIMDAGIELTDIIRRVQSITDYKTAAYYADVKMIDINP
jgi:response regulator RpfG family c-di-GMP phosphodiesterase